MERLRRRGRTKKLRL